MSSSLSSCVSAVVEVPQPTAFKTTSRRQTHVRHSRQLLRRVDVARPVLASFGANAAAGLANRPEFTEQERGIVFKVALALSRQLGLTAELESLIVFGYEGICEARARFDESQGCSFSTYAWIRVRGAILDGCRETQLLKRKGSQEPIQVEVGEALAGLDDLSQDTFFSAAPDHLYEKKERAHRIRCEVDKLQEPVRSVVVQNFYLEKSLAEVAQNLGKSRSWVSRHRKDALECLESRLREYDHDREAGQCRSERHPRSK